MTTALRPVPTIGLALIAKDEEETLPHLLASIEGAFDQVAVLDTGSTDRTVEVYEEWAERQALPLGHKVGHFEWCDDFAAARNAANALLETDWLCWADCDDVVVDADRLRRVVAALPADAAVVAFPCDDYYEGSGTLICPRLFRSGRVVWRGRVHEGPSWRQGMRYDMVDGEHLPRWQHRCRDSPRTASAMSASSKDGYGTNPTTRRRSPSSSRKRSTWATGRRRCGTGPISSSGSATPGAIRSGRSPAGRSTGFGWGSTSPTPPTSTG